MCLVVRNAKRERPARMLERNGDCSVDAVRRHSATRCSRKLRESRAFSSDKTIEAVEANR